MTAKIIIGVTEDETRLGLTEDGLLTEYLVERSTDEQLVGSIFYGRVSNVLRGLEAAFVDIGLSRNAFLYLDKDSKVTEGQQILVQIIKDARGSKGPTATTMLALAGRYAVLLPQADYIGVSKKISDKGERQRLTAQASAQLPQGLGMVLRTAAAEAEASEVNAEIKNLFNEWQILTARQKQTQAPCLLRRELELPVRMVRDYLNPEIKEIIIDDTATYQRVEELLTQIAASRRPQLKLYRGPEDIFEREGLGEAVAALAERQVSLPGGGYLVLDRTEAMTVIDVNSGSFSSRENAEENAMAINRRAATEVARQLRLRDIGGIIVVDFIDMEKPEHKEEILCLLQKSFAGDKMRPKVQDITVLNLVEITRKKARRNFSGSLYTACPVCGGSGQIASRETLALALKRQLRNAARTHGRSKNLLISCHPWLAEYLTADVLHAWERELGLKLALNADAAQPPACFTVLINAHA